MKLRARDEIDAEEERAIREAVAEIRDYPADRVFIRADEPLTVCSLLLDGIACRYKDLRDGQRQITELQVAGDFTDLHSFTLKRLDHHVMALTPCRIAIVPHEAIREITERHPHLTRVYWFATNLDAAIHREWELSLGRRTAVSRLAALLCELQVRLEIVGLADEGGYDLPLSQAELAECLGLTSVHINRMLRELRERGLAELRDRRVTLHDLAALRRAGEFSTSYLYLEQRPR
ncbi:MAG TPA: Crp/Fnr family transcriptional regulator [Allosphingosinicella sp.]|jgi:CRP-like cAMP-binding protein